MRIGDKGDDERGGMLRANPNRCGGGGVDSQQGKLVAGQREGKDVEGKSTFSLLTGRTKECGGRWREGGIRMEREENWWGWGVVHQKVGDSSRREGRMDRVLDWLIDSLID